MKKFVFSRRGPQLAPGLASDDGLPASRDIAIADRRIEGVAMPARAVGTLRVEGSTFHRVSLANSTFGSIVLKDVRFTGCDLANLETRGLSLVRVEFIDCRMTGFRAGEADCKDLLISEGDQRYIQFRY